MMTSAQVVETSVTLTGNSPFQDYPHPDNHTTRSTVTPGFKPFTESIILLKLFLLIHKIFYKSYNIMQICWNSDALSSCTGVDEIFLLE